MAELKTKVTDQSVQAYIESIDDKQKQQDAAELVQMMQDVTGKSPEMWGASMIGFGRYHYKYESGHEGDTFIIGFAPRKQHLVLYGMAGLEDNAPLIEKLGKCKTGKGCMYIKKLSDVDREVLKSLIYATYEQASKKNSAS